MNESDLTGWFGNENGATLLELLLMMALSLVIFSAVLYTSVTGLHQTTDGINQVYANDQVTRTLERLTREIRQTTLIKSVTSSKLDLMEYESGSGSPPATAHEVVWDCSQLDATTHYYYCTRTDGSTVTTEITGLTTPVVFSSGTLPTDTSSGQTAAAYAPVIVTLSQEIAGAPNTPAAPNPLVITQEVTPRNCQYLNDGYGDACD